MSLVRSAAFLLLLMNFAEPASADAFRAPPLKAGPATSIQAYGRQNPDCAEWTNGCVVCSAADGHAHCSMPGIACTPAGVVCKQRISR